MEEAYGTITLIAVLRILPVVGAQFGVDLVSRRAWSAPRPVKSSGSFCGLPATPERDDGFVLTE
jgi:hypothetical protein